MTMDTMTERARATVHKAHCNLVTLLFPLVAASELSGVHQEQVRAFSQSLDRWWRVCMLTVRRLVCRQVMSLLWALGDQLVATAEHADELTHWLREAEGATHAARASGVRRERHVVALEERVAWLESAYAEHKREIKCLEADVTERDRHVRQLSRQTTYLADVAMQMELAKEALEAHQATQVDREQEVEGLRQEVETLKDQVDQLMVQLSTEEPATPLEHLDLINEEMKKKDQVIQGLQHEVEILEATVMQSKMAEQEAQAERCQLQVATKAAEEEIQALKGEIKALETAMAARGSAVQVSPVPVDETPVVVGCASLDASVSQVDEDVVPLAPASIPATPVLSPVSTPAVAIKPAVPSTTPSVSPVAPFTRVIRHVEDAHVSHVTGDDDDVQPKIVDVQSTLDDIHAVGVSDSFSSHSWQDANEANIASDGRVG
ncbi:hypothetical protein Poli38472_008322 [Pythium oligandrum]|uniref:Uncharacterized protein n=1 Tax=Pythium oligandrum TaxID=41045 RepID=A0A8K1CLW9_PYTOL|nr:hypothetical protein Poli38472_008319 [Pythium oligandrum]TMW65680.1 hypothetical protein Poli38472_008322 [Pythium oligandrum]|eukprot:TMW65677.1 hypothetical protein Poli38472_008319 [Pythium oligandrum]